MDVNECILGYTWCKSKILALQVSIQILIHQVVTYLSLAPLLQNFRQRRSSFRNNIHYQKWAQIPATLVAVCNQNSKETDLTIYYEYYQTY